MTNSLLWKIEKPDAEKSSFLFGTIHVYDAAVFQIPDLLYKLIDSVDIYLPEADNRNIAYAGMLNHITVDNPDYSLKNYFDAESYAKILSISKIDAGILEKYKPFFVSSLLLNDDDMPDNSIDSELLTYASVAGKTVCALESFEEQISAIDNISYEEQAEIIGTTLLSLNKINDFNKLMTSYKEQNLQSLTEHLAEFNLTEIFVDSIQKNRNIAMSEKIDFFLNQGHSLFAAVGALHLPDTKDVKGLISLLRDKGYSVEAVDFSFTY